ncbi:MAG: hypothetical protein KC983_00310 [Phycisphaerales bacterium]|nr:hypothetical protein [Phycisphaerales bacterium]
MSRGSCRAPAIAAPADPAFGRAASILTILAVLAAFILCAAPAQADLLPHEVVVVWNSKDATSTTIKNAYVAARPGVRTFDINRAFTTVLDLNNPPELAMTTKMITPRAYEEWIREPLAAFVETQAPETLCFATTRGIPVLITTDFSPGTGHGTENGVLASVEGALTILRVESFDSLEFSGARANPYRVKINVPFRDFVQNECIAGRFFMASRLDAGPGPGTTALDEVLAMINRSQSLVVNKFGVNVIVDDVAMGCGPMSASRAAGQMMRDAGWLVWYDGTDEFLHGPQVEMFDDPQCPCPTNCQEIGFEAFYDAYPDISHASLGRNSLVLCDATANRECVSSHYVQQLSADPAGVFASVESFNGLGLWGGSTAGQGNGLEWMSYAGGSFALLHGYGHYTADAPKLDGVLLNFYQYGMSWAEAAMSSLIKIGFVTVPIGDPLATVQVQNPDVTGDGKIDAADLDLLFSVLSGSADDILVDRHDFDRDGVVTLDDAAVILEVFGRVRPTNATFPIPIGTLKGLEADGCELYSLQSLPLLAEGDVNGDLVIDAADVALLQQAMACQCLEVDVNGDGVIDQIDIDIASNTGDPLDVDGDGVVTCMDMYEIFNNQCFSNCGNSPYDLTGDGQVNFFDFDLLAQDLVDTSGIMTLFDLDFDNNGTINCIDVGLVRDHFCDNQATGGATQGGIMQGSCYDPQYDINNDGVVDCTDEWHVEWILMTLGGQPCTDEGLGCGQCP